MNSVKNLFVCVMLMGVSYGAYQVISAPDPTLEDDQAVDVLDIQIGPRSGEENPLDPMPPQSLTANDSQPFTSPPQSVPPLPKEFSASANPTPPPIEPPPLKVPELTMPELEISQPSPTPNRVSEESSSQFVAQARPAPTPPAPSTSLNSGFVPKLTPPPLASKDPIAFQPLKPPTELPAANNGFDPTPETRLEPVTPKPRDQFTTNQPEPVIRDQASLEISNPYADFPEKVTEVAEQTVDNIKQQVSDNLVEPNRYATEMLDPQALGGRAKELIENGSEQIANTFSNTVTAATEKASEFIPSTPYPEISADSLIAQPAVEPPSEPYDTVDWQGLSQMASNGDTRSALQQLSSHYDSSLPQNQRLRMLEWLDLLAGKVIYSTENLIETRPHVVQQGETLETLANRWDVPAQLIYNINQSRINDPAMLVPGTELKVIPGPFNAVVNIERQELTLFLDGMYAGRFPIELGTDGNGIQHGIFDVQQKSPGREYVGQDGQKIAAAQANNPYGRYWIGLNENLAIHESNPTSGALDQRGSIRLSSRDAADVFGILSSGSKVTVRR